MSAVRSFDVWKANESKTSGRFESLHDTKGGLPLLMPCSCQNGANSREKKSAETGLTEVPKLKPYKTVDITGIAPKLPKIRTWLLPTLNSAILEAA